MSNKTKKQLLLNLPYFIAGLVCTNLGEAWRIAEGADMSEKLLGFLSALGAAFSNPMPSLHPMDLLIGVCCGAGLRLAVYLKGKNAKKYRHGMEYGSARWGTQKDIEPFEDPVFANNVILTRTERLTKTFATLYADQISIAYSGIIGFLMKILTPVIFLVNQFSMGFLFLLHMDPKANNNQMTEEELRTIVDVSKENGVIESEEHEMINNLFDFGDAQAKEVMIPRPDMTFANVNNTYDELIDIFQEDKFTRLPVYEDTTDNVIGILNMKDLLLCKDKEHFSVRDIMREPYFTFEHKNTAELFIEMRKSSISLAIVLDEYGATAGLITLEDLLEEIVGEIRDEYDTDEEDPILPLNDREFIVSGSTNLQDLCDELDLNFSSEDYDTIGGYLLGLLDHLPEKNEIIITDDNVLLRVEQMDKNRIEKVYIKKPDFPPDESDKQ